MSSTPRAGDPSVMRFLAENRLAVYVGGLLAIVALRAVRSEFVRSTFGVEVSIAPLTRTIIVVVSLLLMVVTYIAERRVRRQDDEADEPPDRPRESAYTTRTRLLLGLAVLGVAGAIYVGIEINPLVGGFFLVGAYLFARLAYRGEVT